MSLPVVEATVRVYNPNYDSTDPASHFQVFARQDVEVVQLNLNSGSMRVRFNDTCQGRIKIVTQDVPIADFYARYEIVPKG